MNDKMKFDERYIRNVLTAELKEKWIGENAGLPEYLPVYSEEDRKANETGISDHLNRFQKQMNAFSCLPGRKKRWKSDMEGLLHEILWTEPLLNLNHAMSEETLWAFEEEIKALLGKIRAFEPAFTTGDMEQVLRNYMVYAIFREINGLPQKCTSNIFGYSMLYPYTDNYIDTPGRSREELRHYNELIENQILGKRCDGVTGYDQKTVELLSLAEESFGKADAIYTGLLLMLKAQRESQKQNDENSSLSEDEILTITILKGGISVLIDRYLIDLPLTEKEYRFYFGFGFLLQLCDDLQDISKDKASHCRTVFTGCASKEAVVETVNRLIHLMDRLFDSCQCVREEFREFLKQNCLLLILFSAVQSREAMTEQWLDWIEERLPVSIGFLQELNERYASGFWGKKQKKLMSMIDEYIT